MDVGPSVVGGVTCEQYAFRQADIDWQIWIQLGDYPLPRRLVATTTTDEYGNRQPATAYVLQCKDGSGEVVKEDPIGYSFLWIGSITAIGLILSGVLAFALAAPGTTAGAPSMVTRWTCIRREISNGKTRSRRGVRNLTRVTTRMDSSGGWTAASIR